MKYVIDAHTLIWFFENNPRLGTDAKAALLAADSDLVLPATALAEACWIVERGKTKIALAITLLAAIDADPRIRVAPLDRAVIEKSIGLTAVGEMHDRQIVATALLFADRGETVALLTRDANIMASGLVPVVW